jgi:PKD repeat protein
VAATLADLPAKPCRRSTPGAPPPTNSRPTALFTEPKCVMGAVCQFADGSSDSDGRLGLWRWEFGDGTTSTETNPAVTYAAEGVYSVTLTVTDDAGESDVMTKSVTVSPVANSAPLAGFTLGRCTVTVACGFTDISTHPSGTIAGWRWNFGDGATSTDANPSHIYAAAGTYDVTLEVTDAAGRSDDVTQSLSISLTQNLPPTAAFTVPNCAVSAPCQFADGSSDADGGIATRTWNFGNGATSTAEAPSAIYATAGSYQVTLTVVDDAGDSTAVTQSVTVGPKPDRMPVAAFTAPSCNVGSVCQFEDSSTDPDGTIVSRRWQLGNGSGSTLRNPTVTYRATRSYSVTLTVTDNTGATASVTRMISVAAARPATAPISLNLSSGTSQDHQYVMVTWSGASGPAVDLYRNGALLMTTPNDGRQSTSVPLPGSAGYTYKVCERGKTRCSSPVSVAVTSILLKVTVAMKEPGLQAMTLSWAGATGAMMDVYRSGVRIASTPNTGRYTNTRRSSSQATYAYKVCVAATTKCSKTVSVTVP